MKEFLLFILRSGLYLGVFYAFYLLVMRRTTFFRLNRVVLLAGSALCALLPLWRIRTVQLLAEAGPLTMTGAGVVTAMGSGVFTGVPKDAVVTCPSDMTKTYKKLFRDRGLPKQVEFNP